MSHALCGCVLQVCSMIQSAGSRQMPIYLATLDPCASSMPLEAICFNLVVTGTQKAPQSALKVCQEVWHRKQDAEACVPLEMAAQQVSIVYCNSGFSPVHILLLTTALRVVCFSSCFISFFHAYITQNKAMFYGYFWSFKALPLENRFVTTMSDTSMLAASQKAVCFPLTLGNMPSNLTTLKVYFWFFFFHAVFYWLKLLAV